MDLGSGIKLIHGDCLEEMKHIPDGSVDCIITSPPYNVGIKYNSYFDKIDYCDYIKFIEIFIDSYFHKLSPDGRICINIGDAKNGSIPTHSDFIQILKKYRFIPITTIIWNKNTTSNRCAWGSYLSAKSPSFPRGYEFILIFGKTKSKLSNGTSTITKEEWKEYSNGLWTFAPENKQKEIGHPAMFPIELPTRLIKMLTYKDDIILDPFSGSMTTAIAAINTGRRCICIEKDDNYFKIGSERVINHLRKTQSQLWQAK